MKNVLHVTLDVTDEQRARLRALQQAFAAVCNVLAPVARETRCWNRVALHHMTYRTLRERFPQLGSQMVCNAIYSVSRTCRKVYQGPESPFNVARHEGRPLPLIRFAPTSPVYFDRHTLSLRDGHLSMFTLDGRMRFGIELPREVDRQFARRKLQEIVLSSKGDEFRLTFVFEPQPGPGRGTVAHGRPAREAGEPGAADLPDYVHVLADAQESPTGIPS